jgi:hypothetical protein
MPFDRYDIFRKTSQGKAAWVGSSDSLIRAQQRISQLDGLVAGEEYAIFDMHDSRFIRSFSRAVAAEARISEDE